MPHWGAEDRHRKEWQEVMREAGGRGGWAPIKGGGKEGEQEGAWEVGRLEGARKGLTGVEYLVSWKGWEGYDSWEPEGGFRGVVWKEEVRRARAEGWRCSSWREALEREHGKLGMEARTRSKGQWAQDRVLGMTKQFWRYAADKGGGEEAAQARGGTDKVERERVRRRSEGVRRLYITTVKGDRGSHTLLREDWSYGNITSKEKDWGGGAQWVDWGGTEVLRPDLTKAELRQARQHVLMRLYIREEAMEEKDGVGLITERGVQVTLDEAERKGQDTAVTKGYIKEMLELCSRHQVTHVAFTDGSYTPGTLQEEG